MKTSFIALHTILLILLLAYGVLYSQPIEKSDTTKTQDAANPSGVDVSEEKFDKLWEEFEEFKGIRDRKENLQPSYKEIEQTSADKQAIKVTYTGVQKLSDSQIQNLKDILQERPNDTRIMKNLGLVYLYKGYEGDAEAVNRSQEYFQKIISINKKDAASKAYYGATLILQGRSAWLPWEKISKVEKGITEIDVALLEDSTNLEIRYLRGSLFAFLPELLFSKRFFAISDLEFIINNYDETSGNLFRRNYIDTHIILAKLYIQEKKYSDAKKLLHRAIELAPDTPEASEAKDVLKRNF